MSNVLIHAAEAVTTTAADNNPVLNMSIFGAFVIVTGKQIGRAHV